MKEKEVIKLLSKIDGNLEILSQSDPKGNSYSPLQCVDDNVIYQLDGYEYEVYSTEWSYDEACMTEDEWKDAKLEKDNWKKAVVLAP